MTDSALQALQVLSDAGTGRAFVLLCESGDTEAIPRVVAEALSKRTRVILLKTPRITEGGWDSLTHTLISFLAEKGVRQASFVTFGACCSLVQALALRELKLARTIVFVNAATRAHPSDFTKLIDKIERKLPLGLPLRLKQSGFDAKPFMQRIRCPVLVAVTRDATSYQRAEAEVLEAGLPTAWRVNTISVEEGAELAALVLDFQEVPAKCPQKRAVGITQN